ncbi:MAG: LOG family protein [Pseudomonadota bacterium]
MKDQQARPLPAAKDDVARTEHIPDTPQTRSPTYRLAFDDPDFLTDIALRPVRLQLELLKAQMTLDERGIVSTIVMFGGARIPAPDRRGEARTPELAELSPFYDEARRFAQIVTAQSVAGGNRECVIVTGGGPGVMEAGNLGAAEAGGVSIGLGIVLPHEQAPNLFVTPELSFNFHYFAVRKMHFLMRARAITVFPGGFGTLDELFEALTLIQTKRMEPVPILLFGEKFWREIINWDALAASGTIADHDLELFTFVESADEAVAILEEAGAL